jgi:hypothetical protein
MPTRDGTGPLGCGPLTGRGMGPCGYGLRRGFGRFRYNKSLTLSAEEEKKILEAELREIEAEKEEIQNTLEQM